MAKGENIFHRKDGRWEARYIKGYELSGKIKYGFCYGKTYREAKEKVTKYKAALVNGKAVPTNTAKHRFAYYCNEWRFEIHGDSVSRGLPGNRNQLPQREPKGNARIVTGRAEPIYELSIDRHG